jgi:hypothetical protein
LTKTLAVAMHTTRATAVLNLYSEVEHVLIIST